MMIIVKNNWKLLTGIVLVIVLVSTYLFSDDDIQTTTLPDLLEQENKELFALNTALDTKVQDLKIQAKNLQEIINEKDQQIYHLKITLDENINRINNYSILELEQFFARLKTDSLPH